MSRVAFLLIDLDGYCVSGVNQKQLVASEQEGFRARELGWAFYADEKHAAGSIYFYDDHTLVPLPATDQSVNYARRMHGLPIVSDSGTYGDAVVALSSKVVETLAALHKIVSEITDCETVIVHKGGSEGVWARKACPGATVMDLGSHRCPTAAKVWDSDREIPTPDACPHHSLKKAPKRKDILHCPQIELAMFIRWLSQQ